MITDVLNTFAEKDVVTGGTGTGVVGDVIDLRGLGGTGLGNDRSAGDGEPVYLVLAITTGIVAAGAGTIAFNLVSDSADDLAASPTVHFTTGALTTQASTPAAGVAAGRRWVIALPLEGVVYERYLGITATRGAEAVSAGAISAFLTLDPSSVKTYPDGI